MGIGSIFVSSGNDTRNIVVLMYRRETFLGELCIGVIGSAC